MTSEGTPGGFSSDKLDLFAYLLAEEGIDSETGQASLPTSRPAVLPVSFAQQRAIYNVASAIRITGQLNLDALQQALSAIVQRHEVLRTTFRSVGERVAQEISPPVPVPLPVIEMSYMLPAERAAEVQRQATAEADQPFDLSRDLLLRTRILRLAPDEHILLFTMHHIACDGWSVGLLKRDLTAFYDSFVGGTPAELPALPVQYADYAIWQREHLQDVLESQLTYWKRQLAACPVLDLPTDAPRPTVQTFNGTAASFSLPQSLSDSLQALSKQEGASLFMTLLAAFQTLLARYSHQDDISVGTPIAGRMRQEFEGLIGFFVNTLVLRTDLSGNPSFRELLGRVRNMALEAYAHQDVPFERLVEELQPARDTSHSPLFQVMFALQNAPDAALSHAMLTFGEVEFEARSAKFDLTLSIQETAQGLKGTWEYMTDLFSAATIERMTRHFQTILEAIVADPDQRIADLPLLSARERQQVLVEWNATASVDPADRLIVDMFEAQAAQTPHATAVVFEDQRVSYQELNGRANQLAHYLQDLGVGPEVYVGLYTGRSTDMVVGVLGILKAGAAYVPLDPTLPQERIAFMLDDLGVTVLITQRELAETVPTYGERRIYLDAEWSQIAAASPANLERQAAGENLAYSVYTSGSTGQPKGVMISHHALASRVRIMAEQYALGPGDGVLQFVALSFDAAAEALFPPLVRGAAVVVHRHPGRLAPGELLDLCAGAGVTVLHLPAAYWHQIVDELVTTQRAMPAWLKLVICGGEAPALERLRSWAMLNVHGSRFINAYGPSETTITASSYEVALDPAAIDGLQRVPIGRPLAATQFYILDQALQPVPIGVSGELYIGGDGLARGYHNRPDLTASRFIPHPFSGEVTGARLYQTGDLARYLPDGNVELLGRTDQQVKLRGFRIELGEIEALLWQYPAVKEAIVIARQDQPGEPRLVAYVVGQAQNNEELDIQALRTYLKARLPSYMIPSAFVTLHALPLTPTGKIDRRALPAPRAERAQEPGSAQLALTDLERTIAAIWQEVLQVDAIDINDNFFDLGGHSLLLIQVRNKLHEALGRELAIVDLFQYPTVGLLARHLDSGRQPTVAANSDRAAIRKQAASQQPSAIAVIGMSGRFPGARTIDELWHNLQQGVESITFFTDEELLEAGVDPALLQQPDYVKARGMLPDVDRFDAAFFGFTPREAELMDPQQRLFLESAWEALESAGYDSSTYPDAIGLYAGVSMSQYLQNLYSNPQLVAATGAMQINVLNDKDFLPTRVSYKFNLRGPSINVQTACSTGLVAIHLACQSLRNGECDIALAGGVSVSVPQRAGYLYQEGGTVSPDGHCRSFDARAQGTISGSGVGVVVLKKLDAALADGDTIHAVILGSALNNDGAAKVGYTAPSVDAQAAVIAEALAVSGVEPTMIGYVEAHGSATPLGDPIEVAALTQAFRARTQERGFCPIGSVKTNIGHLDAAAGMAGFIKTVLALKHRQIPPTLHFERPNPEIDFENSPFYVNTHLTEWQAGPYPRRAGVSSFGIGGTNAHLIVEEPPARDESISGRPWQMLALSAQTSEALEAATDNLAAYLARHPAINLADVAYTLHTGRKAFGQRRMLVCRDTETAVRALQSRDPQRIWTGGSQRTAAPVVFMFSGLGDQYPAMARELYTSEPVFRAQIDRCADLLQPLLGCDLRDILYPAGTATEDQATSPTDRSTNSGIDLRKLLARARQPATSDDQPFNRTGITHPALFAIEYALAQLWIEWGVQPRALIGHSLGEYVAACVAGVLSLEDALKLVVCRAQLIETLPRGAMLAVTLQPDQIQSLLRPEDAPQLSIAAHNGPSMSVIAGPIDAVAALETRLIAAGIACQRLQTVHAFHSTMMTALVEPFTELVGSITLKPPKIPYVSNVTGGWITAAEATNPRYWAAHLCRTVRFAEGIETLLQTPGQILLEIGPGQSLSTFARQQIASGDPTIVLASLPHQSDTADLPFVLNTLGRLWLAGAAVDWPALYRDTSRRRVPLPTYPFQRQRYWIDPQQTTFAPAAATGIRKNPKIANWFYIPVWKQTRLRDLPQIDEATGSATHWLLFGSASDLDTALWRRLVEQGHAVSVVLAGSSFAALDDGTYTIDPRQPADYLTLLQALEHREQTPHKIVHLWSATAPADAAADSFDDDQDRGFYSLLFLAQAVAKHGRVDTLTIDVITSGAHSLTNPETVAPGKATLLSMCRVIPQEYPNITCRNIEIMPPRMHSRQAAWLVEQLVAECSSQPTELVVAYQSHARWAQTFDPVVLEEPSPRQLRLRPGGVYLITGGLGGVGLALARYLAATVQARLVLLGRSALPERERWAEWLQTTDDQDVTSRKIRQLQELEALGAEVWAVSADVADAARMAEVLAEVDRRFGTLHGVIHGAGVVGAQTFRTIHEATREHCETQFHAKVRGALVLSRLLGNRSLDFCIALSSIASVLGGIGLAPYAAANLAMDAIAQRQSCTTSIPWISVNWDGWQVGELQVQPNSLGSALTSLAMTPAEGAAAFARIISTTTGAQVIVSTGDLQARLDQWVNRTAQTGQEAAPATQARHQRPNIQTTYAPPTTPTEATVTAIWQELLGIDEIGIHDNFFELGGHSLLGTQIVARLRAAFQIDLSMRSLFEGPTVAQLAEQIERVQAAPVVGAADRSSALTPPPIQPAGRDRPLPLSFAQQRLWFLNQLEPDSAFYNIPTALWLIGELSRPALEQSFAEIVRRHEALRTTFSIVEGTPVQVINAPYKQPVQYMDLRAMPAETRAAEARRLVSAETQRSFDLIHDLLIRVLLIQLTETEHVLVVTMHHIVADGWSAGVLIRELSVLYEAFAHGMPSPLPELSIQYADYAVWQRAWLQGAAREAQLRYWQQQLGGTLPVLQLPTDRPRPPVQSFRGADHPMALSGTLTDALKALSQQEGATLFMTLLAAFQVLLHRYSGQDDILVGTPIANRARVETEDLIGFFANTLVLRADLSGNPSFRELLRRVRDVTQGAYVHQDLPFDQLVEGLQPERSLSYSPIFQVMFVLLNTPMPTLELSGLRVRAFEDEGGTTAKFDLHLSLVETPQGLSGGLQYATDLFDAATISRMAAHFETLLNSVVDHPHARIGQLPMLTGQEQIKPGPAAQTEAQKRRLAAQVKRLLKTRENLG